MSISFRYVAIMSGVQRNGMTFDVVTTRLVRKILRIVKSRRGRRCFASPIAKVGQFIHIEPDSAELYLFVENIEHVLPILSGVGMEEVNKGGPSRPDFSHIRLFSSPIHDKDSSFEAFLICASSILDSSVDDGDVSISVSDIFHFLQRKLVLVDREVFIVDHVIDICPDGVQGKSILLVVGQDIEKFIGIRIPISALMETETPERRQFGLA